ncbi:MAG: hypothetical protein C6I01_02385 [Epsilonproteobacteria bacterium]|nr:hypothetical protein [Campylobacterota bacterium]
MAVDNFDQLPLKEKIEKIEEVIKKEVQPVLAADGGFVEIVDIKEKENGEVEVYLKYGGACSVCSMASGATLFVIEETLRRNLNSQKIRVLTA